QKQHSVFEMCQAMPEVIYPYSQFLSTFNAEYPEFTAIEHSVQVVAGRNWLIKV
uniref:Uncharacterized protein n=1 Tax=Neogobius melanostomus TaxID=47308 RepID=A0A8C6WT89_9GOBI